MRTSTTRHRRLRATTTLGVALVLLSTSAAQAASSPATGHASTSLVGVDLTVSGPIEQTLTVADIGTLATIDGDHAANPTDGPFARAGVVGAVLNGTSFGTAEVTSNGTNTQTAPGVELGDLLGGADLVAILTQAAELTATANAEQAEAVVSGVTGELEVLLGALGVDLDVSTITSSVDQGGASATQGIQITDLGVRLGDLVPVDLLAQLPLSDVLDLLASVGIEAPAVQDVLDLIAAGVADIGLANVDVAAASAALDDGVAALADAVDAHALAASAVGAAEATLVAAQAAVDALPLLADVTTLQAAVAAIDTSDPVGGLTALVTAIADTGTAGISCTLDAPDAGTLAAVTSALSTCLATTYATVAGAAGHLVAAQGVFDATSAALGEATDVLVAAVAAIEALADALTTALLDLTAAISLLAGDAPDLSGVIDDIVALLDELAATSLVEVGAIAVDVSAVATNSVDTSGGALSCSGATVSVLGEVVASAPACTEGIDVVTDALAGLTGALSPVTDVLSELPLAVPTTGIELSMFGTAATSLTSEDDLQTASATLEVLRLNVPSLQLLPCTELATLCNVGLPDLDALVGDVVLTVTSTIEDVQSELADAGISDLSAVQAELDALIAQVNAIADAEALLDTVLDAINLADFGTLGAAVTTPGLNLVIDPTSTASFRGARADLPATGGGHVLLGVGLMAVAVLLRRPSLGRA